MQSCWFCFLLERSSSSGDSHGRLPGLGVRPAGQAGLGSSMGIRSWRVSGVLRPGGRVGQESQGGKAQWSLPRWGWQRPGAGRGPGLWQCRTVRAQARLWQPRGPAGSVRTHGGASPSPCAGKRSRSSGLRCNRCMSRWPCAHNSSSSGGEGGRSGWPRFAPCFPRAPTQLQTRHTLQTHQLKPSHSITEQKEKKTQCSQARR